MAFSLKIHVKKNVGKNVEPRIEWSILFSILFYLYYLHCTPYKFHKYANFRKDDITDGLIVKIDLLETTIKNKIAATRRNAEDFHMKEKTEA